MFKRLKNLLGKNKKELEQIEKHGVKGFSHEGVLDRKEIISDANDLIEELDEADKGLKDAENNRIFEDAERKKLAISFYSGRKSKLEDEVKTYSQGKVKDVISSIFGQIDKKVHNGIFDRETRLSNRLWNKYEDSVLNRYEDLPGYITKNGVVILLLAGVSLLAGQVSAIPQAIASGISTVSAIAGSLVTANLGGKVISTIYNKKKFGGPKLSSYKPLYLGGYVENIKNAIYSLNLSREITGEKEKLEDANIILLPAANENQKEISKKTELTDEVVLEKDDEHVSEKEDEELVAPDIKNYGNIRFGFVEPLESFQTEEGKVKYSKAISYARRVNLNDAEEEDKEKKMAAYDKLFNTFGKRKPRKKKNQGEEKKLNDYNRTLKLLSIYGRKVHENTATPEEYNTYMGLLYHLGKDDDFITDFLSDEYDRYQQDKAEYEKKLAKRI